MPGIIATCNRFYKIVSGDTCDTVARKNGVTVAQFRSWNSEINASCSNLWLDYFVCVGAPGGGGNEPNTPQLPGAAPNCEKWHKIAMGDTCDNIAYRDTITVNQLRTFNRGSTPTAAASSATTSPALPSPAWPSPCPTSCPAARATTWSSRATAATSSRRSRAPRRPTSGAGTKM
ncbi:hypothetical protein RB595_005866 [Gaeumannomyces hyphopodioides]